MKINNIKINGFGKIKNKEIDFKNNINIIYGKNEAGKSTILKFIASILYGANKNKNGKEISDFEQYIPWDESEFSGKLKYELDDGKSYEIFRDFKKKNTKIYNENSEDITKEFNIDKNKGSEFFKEQTGMEEENFYNTILIEQEKIKLEEKEKNSLMSKMTNLVSSGSDNISYKRAVDSLKNKLLEEVGTDRTTEKPLNKTQQNLAKLEEEYENLKKLTDRQCDLDELERQTKSEIEKQENYLNAINDIKSEKENQNIENEIIKNYQNEILILENNLKNKKNENQKTEKNKKTNNKIFLYLIFVFLIIFNIILFLFNEIKIINYLFLSFTIIYFIFVIIKNAKTNKIIQNEKEEKIKEQKEIELLENNLKNKKDDLNNKINNLNNKTLNSEEKIKNNYSGIYLENELQKKLEDIKYDLKKEEDYNNNLKLKYHEIQIEKKNINPSLEKLPEIEEQIKLLEDEKNELITLSNSIKLARDIIEESYEEMKNNLIPNFTEDLSKTINIISNGKYKNVKFNDEEGIIVELENGEYKKVERLSTGTIFQMYLSLRLSIAKQITKEKIPILLDEVFAYYDNERLENILLYLSKEYKDEQILLFTCTDREKQILEKNKINYNFIEI